eukprot:872571-Pyramimonas_sp.AAC.1
MRHLGALSPAIAYKGYPSSSLGSSVGSSGFGTPGAGAGHHPHGGYSYGEGPHTCPAGERPKEKSNKRCEDAVWQDTTVLVRRAAYC